MGWFLAFWVWFQASYVEVVALVTAGIAFAEAVVRLTPTKTDDGAVERLGAAVKRILDFLRVPNLTKTPPPETKPEDKK